MHRPADESRLRYQYPDQQPHVGADGKLRWRSITGEPVFDANGRFKGYRGIGRDITERKRAERALVESERKFRDLTENLQELVYRADPDTFVATGRIRRVVSAAGLLQIKRAAPYQTLPTDSPHRPSQGRKQGSALRRSMSARCECANHRGFRTML